MPWNEIAFSYQQIDDFLSVVALPHREAAEILPFDSVAYRCFCTGFYFFAYSIREELAEDLAEKLLTLAVRVEATALHPSGIQWDQNAEDARALLSRNVAGKPVS